MIDNRIFSRKILSNFMSLSFVQLSNYLFPLITFPYLVRVLRPEMYGLVSFAASFVGYFSILTDYGFNISATREIAVKRNSIQQISEIFSSVLLIKFCFFLISFLLLAALLLFIPTFKIHYTIYLVSFGIVFGNALFPYWFFLGIERMEYISIINIPIKFLVTALIFLFVKQKTDFIVYLLILSGSSIAVGITGLFVSLKVFKIKLILPEYKNLLYYLSEGWNIFYPTLAVSLYNNTNVFLLGLFSNNTIVGYYSGAEKIVTVFRSLISVISQTFYSFLSNIASINKKMGLKYLKSLSIIFGLLSLLFSVFIFLFAERLVYIILGSSFKESVLILRILAPIVFLVGLSTVFANLFLVAFSYTKVWSRLILKASCISILGSVIFIFILKLQHIGISINVLITETIVFCFSYAAYKKYKIIAETE